MKRSHVGRPPLDDEDETTKASFRLPAKEFDRACSQARRDRESLSDLMRRGLKRELDEAAKGE
jgi:hypothetical protein